MKTAAAAQGRWPGILSHFGIDERFLQNRHGPCPLCGGRDRYRFDDKEGRGTFICSQCSPKGGNGFDLLMEWTGKEFKDVAREIDEIVGNIKFEAPKPKTDPSVRLRKVAEGRESTGGINPVRLYLKSRGLPFPSTVEYHPAMDYWDQGQKIGTYPAMLHRVISPKGINLTYHVTHLTPSGQKAPVPAVKKILPPVAPLAGAAIRLTPIAKHLGIAEGVETALAVTEKYGVPCWAAANATLLEKFTPPDGVEEVTIYGDNDKSFAGQKAAYALANRLAQTHQVSVVIPETIGDFADEVRA